MKNQLLFISRLKQQIVSTTCLWLLALCSLPTAVLAQTWENVGTTANVSAGGSSYNNLVTDGAGNYYLSYYDVSVGKGSVQKFDGTSWSYVGGSAGITEGTALFNALAVSSNGNVYYSNQYGWPNSGLQVREFTGSAWNLLPLAVTSAVNVHALAVSADNVPFVYFGDGTVRRYVNNAWEQVGTAAFSAGVSYAEMIITPAGIVYTLNVANGSAQVYRNTVTASATDSWQLVSGSAVGAASNSEQYNCDIAMDAQNNIYVAYVSNGAGERKLNVKKFEGGAWTQVGNANFTDAPVQHVALAVTAAGVPYVAASRWENDDFLRNTVYKFDAASGTWGTYGGSFVSDGEATYNDLVVDNLNEQLILVYSQGNTKAKKISLTEQQQTVDAVEVATQGNAPAVINTNGGTLQLTATVTPATVNQAVIWTITSGSEFAQVDTNGLVTATANGTVTVQAISVLDGTKTDSVTVTISNQMAMAECTFSTLELTGFNADVVAEGTGANANAKATHPVDGANAYYTKDFVPQNPHSSGASAAAYGGGLPNDRTLSSSATQGLSYKIAPYDANNALILRNSVSNTGTLTLVAPKKAEKLYLAWVSAEGINAVNVTVNFADGTSQEFDAESADDWWSETPNTAALALGSLGRVSVITTANWAPVNSFSGLTQTQLFQKEFQLSQANFNKAIISLSFEKENSANNATTTAIIAASICETTVAGEAITGVTITTQDNVPAAINTNGGTLQLAASITPLTANQDVTWSITSGSDFATVNENGLVTGVANGSVTVRATSVQDDTKFGVLNVTVNVDNCPAVTELYENFDSLSCCDMGVVPTCWDSILLNGASQIISSTQPASGTSQIYQTGYGTGKVSIVVLPQFSNVNAGTHQFRFKVKANSGPGALDFGYVTNSNDADTFVLIKGLTISNNSYNSEDAERIIAVPATVPANARLAVRNPGTTWAGMYWDDVYWEPIPVSSVQVATLNGAAPEITSINGTLQLEATVNPADASQDVNWSITSGSDFATVNENGLVTGVANGSVTVRATSVQDDTKFGTIEITIAAETAGAITGFNYDIIANGVGDASASSQIGLDEVNNRALVSLDFKATANSAAPTYGLPANGQIQSANTPGVVFQLADYNGKNALYLTPSYVTGSINNQNSGKLSFTAEGAGVVYILSAAAGGGSENLPLTARIAFSDGSSQETILNAKDWYNGTGYAIMGMGRVNRTNNNLEGDASNPRLYEHSIVIASENLGKTITGIDFAFNGDATAEYANEIRLAILSVTTAEAPVKDVITVTTSNDAPAIIDTNSGTLMLNAYVNGNYTGDVDWSVVEGGTGNASVDMYGKVTAVSNGIVTVRATQKTNPDVYGEIEITITNQVQGYCEAYFVNGCGTLAINNVVTTGGTANINNVNSGCSNDNSLTGYGDYTAQSVAAHPGSTVNFDLAFTGPDAYLSVWIDWNHDFVFSDSERVYFTGNAETKSKANFNVIVPGSAVIGETRIRIKAVSGWEGSGPCGYNSFGEVEDYTFTVTEAPAAVQSVTVTTQDNVPAEITTQNGTLQLVATVNPANAPQDVTWSITAGTAYATVSENGLVTAVANGTVTVRATSATDATKFDDIEVTIATEGAYCIPSASIAVLTTNVQFSDINNSSSTTANQVYEDFTNVTANVTKNDTYTLMAESSGFLGMTSMLYLHVYIDWNQNNVFDEGEFYINTTAGTFSKEITVPQNALTGNTRMRVIIKDNTTFSPCGTSTYGQTEDYTVNISEAAEIVVESVNVTTQDNAEPKITTENGTLQLVATVNPSNAPQDVTWSITAGSEYATVSETGLVTAVSNGTVTVRATSVADATKFDDIEIVIDIKNLGTDTVEANRVAMYPNPVESVLTISASQPVKTVQVYNQLGQLVKTGVTATVDFSLLASGVYIIRAEFINNTTSTQKVIRK